MKRKALLISILFITSILAGCTGNDEDTAKDEMILSLESEIKNITAEKEEALGNNLLLQQTLDASEEELEKTNNDIQNLTSVLTSMEEHRDNLSASLSETMTALNRTYNQSLLAQLENQISNLTVQISDADSEILDLNENIATKQNEVEELLAIVTALESTIGSLTYDMRQKVGSCPMDNPGVEIVAGFDDGTGSGSADDGQLSDDEIQFTIGECPGDYGRVLNTSQNPWGPQLMVKMGNKLIFAANDGIHSWEPWRTDGTV
ncbi:MAG: hypothetical protein ACKVGY_03485, partial [Candidatus Poseidoniales archaeon]